MRAVMQGTLNRASDAIQSRWFDTNGEAFDWFFGAMEGTDVVYGTAENPKVDTSVTSMTETSCPYPKNYDPAEEYYPCFPGCAKCFPTAAPFFDANIEKAAAAAEAAGNELAIYRNTPVKKLIKQDGRVVGVWAGARMQLDGVNMSHAIGGSSYTLGTIPTLFLDKHGKRYMNEDVQGQQVAERIWELKDCIAFQIYDAGLFDHMDDMPYGHGKCAKRMIPIEQPPFFCDRYAGDGTSRGVGHLVTMSGLESDEECRVYGEDMEPIPGLYAAGNVQGNRFAVIYPEVLQGHSIAMAMTFGYIAGKNAAAEV